ncbi:type II toxin-antitoxin system RelE/ParE family toxin [Stutzerimonas stutzeri]|uniref:type II toxin-antitoxin system RelE/ParE family toxin n=1 Tax=Stutzerimonas stutzeri TaxID=316 RepID=UPI0004CF31DA|nr:type II toxin-antitoxin system RelE/ParE family toxin [Stutzerimonas stutzeri]
MAKTSHQNEPRNQQPREIEFSPENAVDRDLSKIPERHRDRFLVSLMLMAKGEEPTCKKKQLGSIDRDIYELCINGSPAWRCIFYTGEPGKIVVLHATDKTTNGSDRQITNVVSERLKAWRSLQAGKGKGKGKA